jgi:putative transposase
MTKRFPIRYFKTSPEIIRLAISLYIRFSMSLRSVEDLLHERGIEISHETVRYWWKRFGPIFDVCRGNQGQTGRGDAYSQSHRPSGR